MIISNNRGKKNEMTHFHNELYYIHFEPNKIIILSAV